MFNGKFAKPIPQRVMIITPYTESPTRTLFDTKLSQLITSLSDLGCSVVLVSSAAITPLRESSELSQVVSIGTKSNGTRPDELAELLDIYKPELVLIDAAQSDIPKLVNLLQMRQLPFCYAAWTVLASDIDLPSHRYLAKLAQLVLLDDALASHFLAENSGITKLLRFDTVEQVKAAAIALQEVFCSIDTSLRYRFPGTSLYFSNIENIPITRQFEVNVGELLEVIVALEYVNCDVTTKKAVLTFKCFDKNGDFIHKADGFLPYSNILKSFYTYLSCGSATPQVAYKFKVPAQADTVEIGVCGFNLKAQEYIKLYALDVVLVNTDTTSDYALPSTRAATISITGWPAITSSEKPVVLGIMDEFTTGCFEQDVCLIQPRPDNWFALLEKYQPDLVFIESAWKGNGGSWQYRVAEYANKPGLELNHLIDYARKQAIPVVFWNKEDPVHHEKFMDTAKQADHIFTTDSNMLPSYQRRARKSRASSLAFAAQPVLHKPAGLQGRKEASCFAGSWYGNRHAERGESMRWLLEAANKYPLDIYDRNFGTGVFPFPEQFNSSIKGSLPYLDLCGEYNRYRVFLNVNSVTDSPTMFSRRVFELMACGTPIVSTYARGIAETFSSDAVWLINSQEEAEHAIYTLLNDDNEWRRRSLAGIREVFSAHTYAHRLEQIFSDIGLARQITLQPKVVMLCQVKSEAECLEALATLAQQTYKHRLLLFIAPNGQTLLINKDCYFAHDLSSALALAAELGGNFVAPISLDMRYGDAYLQDLVNATVYQPEADFWGVCMQQQAFSFGLPLAANTSMFKLDYPELTERLSQPLTLFDKGYGIDSDQVSGKVSAKG